MIYITQNESESIDACTDVYIKAYKEAPWEETYEHSVIKAYIEKFVNTEARYCFVLKEDNDVIGVALCIKMPGTESDYLRIEDFCVTPMRQRSGLGSRFMKLIGEQLERLGCDSILLGTQKDFPSHRFYVKNGFEEIADSVLLYYEPEQEV